MRLLAFFWLLVTPSLAAVPALLGDAVKRFRADPPRGWSYIQTTSAEGKSTIERCDAAKPEFERWSLIEKDGRAPTAAEIASYGEARSRRSRGGTAPNLVDQLDLEHTETIEATDSIVVYRCAVKRADAGDKTADFLRATVRVHKPTTSIASIELASTGPFSPTFFVRIAEMRTVMTYSPPEGDRPSLPDSVETRVRGTAFWFKSLDADMRVTYSSYERAGKRR